MKLVANFGLPNGIVLVLDYGSSDIPESMGGSLIATTPTCVAVGALNEQFGSTELVLADHIDEVDQTNTHILFDGQIECPSGEISLVSALDEKLLSMPLNGTSVRVRVFVNDDIEPDKVAIVLG